MVTRLNHPAFDPTHIENSESLMEAICKIRFYLILTRQWAQSLIGSVDGISGSDQWIGSGDRISEVGCMRRTNGSDPWSGSVHQIVDRINGSAQWIGSVGRISGSESWMGSVNKISASE